MCPSAMTVDSSDEEVGGSSEAGRIGSPVAAGRRLEELALERARRRYDAEDFTSPRWSLHKKHVFVLSSAGKPIFSRYGDESKLAPQMGLLQALISFVHDRGDAIRYIRAGPVNIVFVLRGPLYLVAVSSTGETVEHLWRQLGLLHAQIISILTSKVDQIFQRNASFDVRGLLGGTDRVMRSLLHAAGCEPAMLLQAIPCLRVPPAVRAELGRLLAAARPADLLFGLLLAHNHLVTLMRPRRSALHADDLLLVMNTVASSASFREDEAWLPICLPRFNDAGFLYAHISYVAPELCDARSRPAPLARSPSLALPRLISIRSACVGVARVQVPRAALSKGRVVRRLLRVPHGACVSPRPTGRLHAGGARCPLAPSVRHGRPRRARGAPLSLSAAGRLGGSRPLLGAAHRPHGRRAVAVSRAAECEAADASLHARPRASAPAAPAAAARVHAGDGRRAHRRVDRRRL